MITKCRVWNGEEMLSLSRAMYLDLVGVQYNREDAFELEPYFEGVKILQYTGLTDKNGVEVYEGDVVKGEYYNGTPCDFKRIIGAVKYHSVSFQVEGVKQYEGMRKPLNGAFQVIGNIHQNPELLSSDSDKE